MTNGTVFGAGRAEVNDRGVGRSVGFGGAVFAAVAACAGTMLTATPARAAAVTPPGLTKVFTPPAVTEGNATTLTFTITNSNGFTFTGVAFTDVLPAGLTVANSTSTACGGTLTTTAPATIALANGSVDPGACQFSVPVTASTLGHYVNTTGAISTSNGGDGNTATTPLDVVPAIPALAGWGLAGLVAVLAGGALLALRRLRG